MPCEGGAKTGAWRPTGLHGVLKVPVVHSARVSGSPAPLRVVRTPVVFLVATVRWPPAAALPVWTLFFGAVPREDRHLGALKMVFCPQAHAGNW